MKNDVANSSHLFVDRPLANNAPVDRIPSLWMLSKDNTDLTDAALRVFLMICLVASLVLGGMRMNSTPDNEQDASFQFSVGKISVEPAMPKVSFAASIR